MGKRKKVNLDFAKAMEFLNHLAMERPLLSYMIPLVLVGWAIERWIFTFSNWVPLVVAVWATIQYGNYQRRTLVEDMNKKWKQVVLHTSPITPLEHCEWLNKLVMEIWPSFINPKISLRFGSIIEKRLKRRKSRLIEKIELEDFSLGSCAPSLGLYGTRWSTTGDQRFMRLGFDWDSTDINIMLLAKLAKPLMGAARIVINSLHIKGELILMPVLDGQAVLYSFLSTPEVRIGVAFGSGGSQALPATELPGVSSWLVKVLSDTLDKTMVEPRRRCLSLPPVDLRKRAVGGIVYVTVVEASKLSGNVLKGSPSRNKSLSSDVTLEESQDDKGLRTFVEVEIDDLTRRTNVRTGSNPRWDSTFNMVLHEDVGLFRFHLYQCTPGSVKYDYLTSCEVKMKYVDDDSTCFWAIGPDSSAIAKRVEFCGKEIEMVVPFEGDNSGELTVKLIPKEWHFSDGSHSIDGSSLGSRHSVHGSSNTLHRTGRKIIVYVIEGRDIMIKDKYGRSNPYIKMQYGKVVHKTKSVQHTSNPLWNQRFEFDEIGGGEYLMIKCHSEETFGDDSIGSARVNLEGLVEGSVRDVWIPLEKVSSGELRLQIEVVKTDYETSMGRNGVMTNGLVELVLIEAKDLIAADLRGTSDPFVSVQYGSLKRRTKIIYKTLNPKWHQTLEFPDDGSPLELHVKDHNSLLPASNIGDCVVEYQMLPPNQTIDKWIPLQGVKKGEIHVQVTRKNPELEKKNSLESDTPVTKAHEISGQIKDMMSKFHSLIEDGDLEGLSDSLSELENLYDNQEDYLAQLETEQSLLLNKINELGQEMLNSSPVLSRRFSSAV